MMETFIAAITPIYTIALGILIPLAIGYGLKLLQARTGITIEQADREALQTAIRNAALLAVQKSGGASRTNIVTEPAVTAAVEYVRNAVPDAVGRFEKQGLDDSGIAKRVLPQAQAIVDAVPTITDMQNPSIDAFVRQAINR